MTSFSLRPYRDGDTPMLTTDASLAAQPFFARQGFQRLAEQVVERNGQTLRNCHMTKTLATEEQHASLSTKPSLGAVLSPVVLGRCARVASHEAPPG